jgi:predicted unusual protein kinase regulating ubiquinone biosynthesis (AarF/ABC1/UbiB family)
VSRDRIVSHNRSSITVQRYDAESIAKYYRKRPWQLIFREINIIWSFTIFLLHLGWDRLWQQTEKNKYKRADELRETLTRLGPTFIKVGQALSTN